MPFDNVPQHTLAPDKTRQLAIPEKARSLISAPLTPDEQRDLTLLKATRDQISNPKRWCQGAYFANGGVCLMGALFRSSDFYKWYGAEARLIRHMPARFHRIQEFNDHVETTHAAVLALCDAAIDELQANTSRGGSNGY